MKRFLATLLILISVFSLCACGSKPEPKYYGTWTDEWSNVVLELREDGTAIFNSGIVLKMDEKLGGNALALWEEGDPNQNLVLEWVSEGFGTIIFQERVTYYVPYEDEAVEGTEPEATEPEATEPEATEPEATEPEATEPEATEPEATEPEATEPEATEPEATEPEATEPEATEPEATEPEATEPEATEPEATEPEATEPEATEPEATEPEATEPGEVETPAGRKLEKLVNVGWGKLMIKDGKLYLEIYILYRDEVRNSEETKVLTQIFKLR